MDNLTIFILIMSTIIAYDITKEIFTIRKTSTGKSEARRFFEEMSENKGQTDGGELMTCGLTLAKKKGDEKYTLIPQSKRTGLSLS